MTLNFKEIENEFTSVFDDCLRFACMARAKPFQVESCEKLIELTKRISTYKNKAIKNKDEEGANRLLYYQMLAEMLLSEMKMWISFKDNDPEVAWDHLVNSQSSLRAALLAHDVGSRLEPYVEKLDLLEELLFPKMMFFSVGFQPIKKTCSICSSNYDSCEHIKGKPYLGELCHTIIEECEIEEVSVVDVPANKHCRAISIEEDGCKRNIMTWEVIESE